MALTRKEKEQIVAGLVDKLKKAKSAVFTDFTGLKMDQSEKLRKQAKKDKAEYFVAKKSLLKIALKEAGMTDVPVEKFTHSVGTLFGYEDVTAAPKIAAAFAKDNKVLSLLSGLMADNEGAGKYIALEQVKALAALPGKQELLAKLVGTIKAPITGFVNVLGGNLRNLVNVLNAVKEKKPAQ